MPNGQTGVTAPTVRYLLGRVATNALQFLETGPTQQQQLGFGHENLTLHSRRVLLRQAPNSELTTFYFTST